LLPSDLAPLYPIWRSSDAVDGVLCGFGVVLVAVVIASALLRRRLLCFVTLSFLVMLLPVANLIATYFQRADRYLSLALIWPAFGLGSAVDAARVAPRAAKLGLLAWVIVLASLNLRYQPAWANDETLWRHGTQAQPRAFYAWIKLGQAERAALKYPAAQTAFENAIAAEPTLVLGHSALFHLVVHQELGPQRQALADQLAAFYHAHIDDPAALAQLSVHLARLQAVRSVALVTQRLRSNQEGTHPGDASTQ
jgi:tetratricopeptide (TPR) repeat protein